MQLTVIKPFADSTDVCKAIQLVGFSVTLDKTRPIEDTTSEIIAFTNNVNGHCNGWLEDRYGPINGEASILIPKKYHDQLEEQPFVHILPDHNDIPMVGIIGNHDKPITKRIQRNGVYTLSCDLVRAGYASQTIFPDAPIQVKEATQRRRKAMFAGTIEGASHHSWK